MNPAHSRRTFLRTLGVSISLPLLETFQPRRVWAMPGGVPTPPKRMAVLYFPNGALMDHWKPQRTGTDFDLPRFLQPLAAHRDEMLVLGGLDCDKAYSNGDGAGDHARSMSGFLTATQVYKTGGKNIRSGVSLDQLIAQKIGQATRFPSLELSCEYGKQDGICDSGYACTYSNNLSWSSPTTPSPKEVNPRLVFDRLFAGQSARATSDSQAQRELYNQSILDFVRDEIQTLNRRLSGADRRRVDEYLTSIREVERRITAPPAELSEEITSAMPRPLRIPASFREHFRLMADLLVLAFQGDLTRTSTLVFGVEGSRKTYPEAGVIDEHHSVSHHRDDPEMQEKYAKITEFHVGELAYFIERMKSVQEGEGTLLDQSMVLYGSANADGHWHIHKDLPILLFGRGGGTISPGRCLQYPDGTPVANLFLSMLDRLNIPLDRFGDSTGRVDQLQV